MNEAVLDVLIVGGGMVGASVALALKHAELNLGLIEAQPLHTHSQPSYDDRGIAISQGSQRILEHIGIWQDITAKTTVIKRIHVSDRGRFGVTRLSAEQENVPALGYVLTARHLGETLNKQLQKQQNIKLFCPAKVAALHQHSDYVEVVLEDSTRYQTKLLVAADGRDSTIRQLSGINCWLQQYDQTAITANISTDKPHHNQAFERFTEAGPMALLPMSDNRSSLIWTVKSSDVTRLLNLSETDFLHALQQSFGYRAGRFVKVGQRHSYPLTLMQADRSVQDRIVMIGNAAHNLHPIAGQGLNLGLRDVAVLVQSILDNATDPGNSKVLSHYQSLRQQDQDQLVNATDNLVRLFSNNISLLAHLRGTGLALLDMLPPAKKWLARRSMGLTVKLPRPTKGSSQ